jgi:hypothetical protein
LVSQDCPLATSLSMKSGQWLLDFLNSIFAWVEGRGQRRNAAPTPHRQQSLSSGQQRCTAPI